MFLQRCIFCLLLVLIITPNNSITWAIELIGPDQKNIINPLNDAITHNQKGLSYLERGYPLHAIDEYKLAIMLNPNSFLSASIYNNLGQAYEKINQYNYAIVSYQNAIKINPDFSVYYKNLVDAYNYKKILNKAQKDYETILEINPEDAEATFILGLIYMKQNNSPKAITTFENYIKLQPNRDLTNAAKKYIFDLKKPK